MYYVSQADQPLRPWKVWTNDCHRRVSTYASKEPAMLDLQDRIKPMRPMQGKLNICWNDTTCELGAAYDGGKKLSPKATVALLRDICAKRIDGWSIAKRILTALEETA